MVVVHRFDCSWNTGLIQSIMFLHRLLQITKATLEPASVPQKSSQSDPCTKDNTVSPVVAKDNGLSKDIPQANTTTESGTGIASSKTPGPLTTIETAVKQHSYSEESTPSKSLLST